MRLKTSMSRSAVLLCLCFVAVVHSADPDRRGRYTNPTYYNVGGVLSSNESVAFFKDTISVSLPRSTIAMSAR